MVPNNTNGRKVKTTETVFAIIDMIKKLDEPGIADLANELDLAYSTVHAHVNTLEDQGFLVKDHRGYRIGLRFLDYGMHAKQKIPISTIGKEVISRLAEETGEGARLWMEENGLSIVLERALGPQAVSLTPYDRPGHTTYLHCHAGGKAILAYLPDERVDEITDHYGLPRITDHTITDPDKLRSELEAIRDRGFAYTDEETIIGVRSIGAPIIVEGTVLGSISVAGPANRFNGEFYRTELPELILGSTNEIELEIAHSEVNHR